MLVKTKIKVGSSQRWLPDGKGGWKLSQRRSADFKVVQVQTTLAPRRRLSSMGAKIKKGDRILHISSSRATGEVFVFTRDEISNLYLEMYDPSPFKSL
jgi:hypothetical protein